MRRYEFKVVPMPAACTREARSSGADPVAATFEEILNTLAVEGWSFLRSEGVGMFKGGLFGRKRRIEKELLIFRRERALMPDRAGQDRPSGGDDIRERIERTLARRPVVRSIDGSGPELRRMRPAQASEDTAEFQSARTETDDQSEAVA